jgi:hypothetical protein
VARTPLLGKKGSDTMMKAIGRRTAIATTAVLAGAGAMRARAAVTYGITPQSAVAYRDSPNGSSDCTNCMHFIPGPSATADGHCTVVAGSISPQGWCAVWTAKS